MIIKRKYVASVSRRGKNSQSRCAKQGSRGPNSICLWRGGPQQHCFWGKEHPKGNFFFMGGGESRKAFLRN